MEQTNTHSVEKELNDLIYSNLIEISTGQISEPHKSLWKKILSQPINFNYVHESNPMCLLSILCRYLHESNLDLWEIICSHQLEFNNPSLLDAHTPLMIACRYMSSNVQIWKLLVKFPLNFNLKTRAKKSITTPITEALKHITDIEIWKIILEFSIDWATETHTYYSPLMVLFEAQTDAQVIKLCLSNALAKGTDFNTRNIYGFSPIHCVCPRVFPLDVWTTVLATNPDFNSKTNFDMYHVDHNSTPLLKFCSNPTNGPEVWELILSSIPDLNFYDQNYWGRTPLTVAFKTQTNFQILKLIIGYTRKYIDLSFTNLILDNELKTQVREYIQITKPAKTISMEQLLTQYNEFVNSANLSSKPTGLELFYTQFNIHTKSYFTTYSFPGFEYKWQMQITGSQINSQTETKKYTHGHFPVGWYNPHDKAICFGLSFGGVYFGACEIKPGQSQMILSNRIIPLIPKVGSEHNITLLMMNKLEPKIIYCKLPWGQINYLMEELVQSKYFTVIPQTDLAQPVRFCVISDQYDNMFISNFHLKI